MILSAIATFYKRGITINWCKGLWIRVQVGIKLQIRTQLCLTLSGHPRHQILSLSF